MNIYKCNNCHNIIFSLNDKNIECCHNEMELLVANTSDGAIEKHVPVCIQEDNKLKVTVGEIEHPMTEEHYIEWILLQYKNGFEIKYLHPNNKPIVYFNNTNWENIYVYCNLHNLWKKAK